MIAKLRSWWQQIKQHPYATGIVVLLMLVLFIFLAYRFGWDWTGFNSGTNQITLISTSKGNYTATISQPSKSLWDWLQLLGVLAIPVVVGLGAAWYTVQQGKVSNQENKDNQREAALQAYIDKISELLLKEHLGEQTADKKLKSEYEQVQKIARVRTITVLTQLDARRISYVFAFLREAGLNSSTSNGSVVTLRFADLRRVNWSQANLWLADLSAANLREANLSEADLSEANLNGANLYEADLRRANLSEADLREANLSESDLSEANLNRARLTYTYLDRANLNGANLKDAILSTPYLEGADLSEANLTGANLNGARVTEEQLKKAKTLFGATMPDKTVHP